MKRVVPSPRRRVPWYTLRIANEATLFEQIRANPDDDEPRRVYADELLARSDPRGELIAVQCELAALGYAREPVLALNNRDWVGDALGNTAALDSGQVAELRTRERKLLARHGSRWVAPLGAFARGAWQFRRGFLHHATWIWHALPGTGSQLFAAAPLLASVTLIGMAAETFASEGWNRVRALQIASAPVLGADFDHGALIDLRALSVQSSFEVLAGLTRWPRFAQLHTIQLAPVTTGSIPSLASRVIGAAGPLRELQLYSHRIVRDDVEALAHGDSVRELAVLSLCRNGVTDEHIDTLARGPALGWLRALDLRTNQIKAPGAAAIGAHFGELRTLRLTSNRLGSAGVIALVSGGGLGALRELTLHDTGCDDAALQVLAESALMSHLKELDLRRNGITDDGALTLAGSPACSSLRWLDLRNNRLGTRGRDAIASSRYLANTHIKL